MTGTSPPVRIGILGARGRMGRAIAAAATDAGAIVAGGVDRDGAVDGPFANPATLAGAADVLVDFSAPGAVGDHLAAAVDAGTPMLIGTTGLGAEHHAAIDAAAARIAIVQAANTSLGIAVLERLVRQATAALGPDWDVEILEMHHRHKLDAPSGTALLLGAAAAVGRGAAAGMLDRTASRSSGAREPGSIGYASLRGGTVAGDHSVILAGEGERIEFTHRAESRAIFARGAVRGATWLAASRTPGRYTMGDVLGLD